MNENTWYSGVYTHPEINQQATIVFRNNYMQIIRHANRHDCERTVETHREANVDDIVNNLVRKVQNI